MYIPITGLWSRKTGRGEVLSAKLNDATRKKLIDTLTNNADTPCELVVFVNDKRDKDTSPTHNLVINRKDTQDDDRRQAERAAAPAPERQAASRQPGDEPDEPF